MPERAGLALVASRANGDRLSHPLNAGDDPEVVRARLETAMTVEARNELAWSVTTEGEN